MDSIIQHSSVARLRKSLKASRPNIKRELADTHFTDADLTKRLPLRATADRLVHMYFESFETTYRILHAPTFWNEYHMFWADPSRGRPEFAVLLLLTMATVRCMYSEEPVYYVGESSSTREISMLWVSKCEAWVQRQSHKHQTIEVFQAHCLLLLAKQANDIKMKQIWLETGSALRHAMSAGLHRDPRSTYEDLSPFDQEMRRRLWATLVELDLQASIDRGMPATSSTITCGTAAPLNINDDDLLPSLQQLPVSLPRHEYTATAFLSVSQASLPLRVALNAFVNEPGSTWRYDDILAFDKEIMQSLDALPRWTDNPAAVGQGPTLIPQMLLDLQLRQYLLLLHSPFALEVETNSRYAYSKWVCVNTISTILDHHSRLLASGSHVLLMMRHDIFCAALTMCRGWHTLTAGPASCAPPPTRIGLFR